MTIREHEVDEQYWREFAIKFARKRGVSNMEQLTDLAQDAITKIYSIDLTRLKNQKEFERFVGRAIANMIRDWQRKERLRTHLPLFDFTYRLSTTDKIEDAFVDYLDATIPKRVTFNGGQQAIIDPADYPVIESHNWHLKNCGRQTYARTWHNKTHVYLQRLIVSRLVEPSMLADNTVNFLNGNTLDCRRANLAIGTVPLIQVL